MKRPKEVFHVYLILKLTMISTKTAKRPELVPLNRASPSTSELRDMLLQPVR